jgi:hypothetical protein
VARDVKTRLTFGSASSQANLGAVWSRDGRWIAYTCNHAGKFGLCRRPSDGSGSEEILLEGGDQVRYLTDWSQDGKFLAYRELIKGISAVWMLPVSDERKPYPFLQSQFTQLNAHFSPDATRRDGKRVELRGRHLAYAVWDSASQRSGKLRCRGGWPAVRLCLRIGAAQRSHHPGCQLDRGCEEMTLAARAKLGRCAWTTASNPKSIRNPIAHRVRRERQRLPLVSLSKTPRIEILLHPKTMPRGVSDQG